MIWTKRTQVCAIHKKRAKGQKKKKTGTACETVKITNESSLVRNRIESEHLSGEKVFRWKWRNGRCIMVYCLIDCIQAKHWPHNGSDAAAKCDHYHLIRFTSNINPPRSFFFFSLSVCSCSRLELRIFFFCCIQIICVHRALTYVEPHEIFTFSGKRHAHCHAVER